MRTCIGCRNRAPSNVLMRVIRRSDGTLEEGRSLPGRGAWLCLESLACVDHAQRRRAFDRALRGSVPPESIAGLRERIKVRRKVRLKVREDGIAAAQRHDRGMKGLR